MKQVSGIPVTPQKATPKSLSDLKKKYGHKYDRVISKAKETYTRYGPEGKKPMSRELARSPVTYERFYEFGERADQRLAQTRKSNRDAAGFYDKSPQMASAENVHLEKELKSEFKDLLFDTKIEFIKTHKADPDNLRRGDLDFE